MTVAAIVLAAGGSRRLGQPKQLLRLEGETLVERAVRLAGEAGANPVLAVLGAHHESIRAAVSFDRLGRLYDAIPVLNGGWEQGIATSIHAALEALEKQEPAAQGVLILGCDQPRLTATHLRAMLETFEAQTAPVMVASAYAGVEGVPAIFPGESFAELRALRGDEGARSVLKRATWPVIALPFPGGEVDIDQPGDLGQLESFSA
jgi:molybdenum cofactor cytidylyltransferase